MQVGAHLWHEGPVGGLSGIPTHKLSTLPCPEAQALPLSHPFPMSSLWHEVGDIASDVTTYVSYVTSSLTTSWCSHDSVDSIRTLEKRVNQVLCIETSSEHTDRMSRWPGYVSIMCNKPRLYCYNHIAIDCNIIWHCCSGYYYFSLRSLDLGAELDSIVQTMVVTAIAIGFTLSKQIRCTLCLVFPTVFTREGRFWLSTITYSLLLSGELVLHPVLHGRW